VTRGIVSFELRLPDRWYGVPAGGSDVEPWARSTATQLVRGVAEGRTAVLVEDAIDVLAEQLADVAAAARATGIAGLETAVLVRRPETGVVDAMLTLVGQQGLGEQEFVHQLVESVEQAEEDAYAYAGHVEGVIDAGTVRGLHVMIAHAEPGNGEGAAVLEERVILGVFPEGAGDMVEITAIARGVGSFDDMPQDLVDLLGGLTVDTEAVR
jgi:hypothetical protein